MKDRGNVCFTFDDRNFKGWLDAMPLFRNFHAHATFFVCGPIDSEAADCMKVLQSEGHSLGLHTMDHADSTPFFESRGGDAYYREQILPQLEACRANGLRIRSFGYPNNRHSDETDSFLGKYFQRFRAGNTGLPEEKIYLSSANPAKQRVMCAYGIGEYYHTVESELLAKLEHASETGTCVSFFSHDIAEKPNRISISVSLLESCLKKAEGLGLKVCCFDELPQFSGVTNPSL